MFAASTIRRIERELAAGKTQRALAAELGISRSTISLVATRRITSAQRKQVEESMRIAPTRCGRCGATCVEAPCRTCLTRGVRARSGVTTPATPEEPTPVALELKGEDAVRYRQIRQVRRHA